MHFLDRVKFILVKEMFCCFGYVHTPLYTGSNSNNKGDHVLIAQIVYKDPPNPKCMNPVRTEIKSLLQKKHEYQTKFELFIGLDRKPAEVLIDGDYPDCKPIIAMGPVPEDTGDKKTTEDIQILLDAKGIWIGNQHALEKPRSRPTLPAQCRAKQGINAADWVLVRHLQVSPRMSQSDSGLHCTVHQLRIIQN